MSSRRILIGGIALAAIVLFCSGEALPPPPAGNHDPELLKRVEPKYPSELARAGVTDTVEFTFLVETTGDVGEIKILKSRAPEFAKATIAAVKKWKFRPAVKDGVYVRALLRNSISFDLH
jgi:protein TonB